MENKLEIRKVDLGGSQRIIIEGRLDANWAGHLDEYLNNLVREGSYNFTLSMGEVKYLSSAGIRILVSQYKKMKQLGGSFVLDDLSEQVSEVLSMVGMKDMFTEGAAFADKPVTEELKPTELNGFRFTNKVLSDNPMTFTLAGNPESVAGAQFTASDNFPVRFSGDMYGLGIGAIGRGFDDCRYRYGEFLAVGNALAYKPSDGSKLPDWVLRSGRMEPEINALYAMQASGSFSNRIAFDPVEINSTITIGKMISGISTVTGFGKFICLAIAESEGLVGVSLNAPPVGGHDLFEFPEVRERVNFTTEPAYQRMLTISLGFYSAMPDLNEQRFLRPLSQGSRESLHIHTAVFPYQALSKNELWPGEMISRLFETSVLEDVIHLINDYREIAGVGESSFRHGIAWVARLS